MIAGRSRQLARPLSRVRPPQNGLDQLEQPARTHLPCAAMGRESGLLGRQSSRTDHRENAPIKSSCDSASNAQRAICRPPSNADTSIDQSQSIVALCPPIAFAAVCHAVVVSKPAAVYTPNKRSDLLYVCCGTTRRAKVTLHRSPRHHDPPTRHRRIFFVPLIQNRSIQSNRMRLAAFSSHAFPALVCVFFELITTHHASSSIIIITGRRQQRWEG